MISKQHHFNKLHNKALTRSFDNNPRITPTDKYQGTADNVIDALNEIRVSTFKNTDTVLKMFSKMAVLAQQVEENAKQIQENKDYIDSIMDKLVDGDLKYTNPNPTPDLVGHIKPGTTFDNVPLTEMWTMLLYDSYDIYYGVFQNNTITESEVKNNLTRKYTTKIQGIYDYNGPGYKYFIFPKDHFTLNKFMDPDTGFQIAMELPWELDMNDGTGTIVKYSVYRSYNYLGGDIRFEIT